MCVIIHKPAGVEFDEKDLKLAYENNPHGFGYMYYDPKAGIIRAQKKLYDNAEQIIELVKSLKDIDACFHWRWKTEGEIVNAQCHPFKVLDRRKNGVDMFFMHNGTIRKVTTQDKESDTQAFCRDVLKPILSKTPSLVRTQAFHDLVSNYIGESKLCFMYGDGKVVKINEDKGAVRHDCWVSNEYSFRKGHRNPPKQVGTSYYNNRTTNSSNTTVGVGSSKLYNKVPVKVGDSVHVFHSKVGSGFSSTGKIKTISANTIYVEFTNVDNETVTKSFWRSDGECYQNKDPKHDYQYYLFPSISFDDTTIATKVGDLLKEEKEETETPQKKVPQVITKAGTSGVETDNKVTNLEEVKKKARLELEDKSKESSTNSPPEKGEDELTQPVSYGGLTVDAKDRWGGDWIEDPSESDYDGVSIYDIYTMTPQDKFTFFMQFKDVSFNMFQDLVEELCTRYDGVEDPIDYYEDYEDFLNEELPLSEMPTVNKKAI